jgi:hypothetical protein
MNFIHVKLGKTIKFFIPALISILILGILFSRFSFTNLYEVLSDSNKVILLLSPIVIIFTHLLNALRWKIVLEMLGANVFFGAIAKFYFANVILTKVFPLYSGDFMRAYYLRDKLSMTKHAGGIFLGIVVDVAVLALFSLTGGILTGEKTAAFFGGAIFFLMAALCGAMTVLGRYAPIFLRDKIQAFVYAFRIFIQDIKLLLFTIFLTAGNWFLVAVFVKLAFLAFGVSMPLLAIISFQPIVTLVSMIPVTIWGVGVRESVMLFLFAGLAQGSEIFAVGLTYFFVGGVLLPVLFLPITYKVLREIIH